MRFVVHPIAMNGAKLDSRARRLSGHDGKRLSHAMSAHDIEHIGAFVLESAHFDMVAEIGVAAIPQYLLPERLFSSCQLRDRLRLLAHEFVVGAAVAFLLHLRLGSLKYLGKPRIATLGDIQPQCEFALAVTWWQSIRRQMAVLHGFDDSFTPFFRTQRLERLHYLEQFAAHCVLLESVPDIVVSKCRT